MAHREQWHQNRLVEHDYFAQHGASTVDAKSQAGAWIGQQALTQTNYLAYIDVFYMLMLISIAAIPLALVLRPIDLRGKEAESS